MARSSSEPVDNGELEDRPNQVQLLQAQLRELQRENAELHRAVAELRHELRRNTRS